MLIFKQAAYNGFVIILASPWLYSKNGIMLSTVEAWCVSPCALPFDGA
jgi:hypothetical protein